VILVKELFECYDENHYICKVIYDIIFVDINTSYLYVFFSG